MKLVLVLGLTLSVDGVFITGNLISHDQYLDTASQCRSIPGKKVQTADAMDGASTEVAFDAA